MDQAALTVWYSLVDGEGAPAFERAIFDKVNLSTGSDVVDLRDAVWNKNQRIIEGVAAQLQIYSNKADITDLTKVPLAEDMSVDGMGQKKETALFVVVPKSHCG
jgi:hypothetical protein